MSRYHEVLGMAEAHAKTLGESPEKWMGYLDTASRLYRYPFMDSLLIHAQKPQATACAELETWNDRMFRWVNRGAKGIALIDRRGGRKGVRYVFDVQDTHPVKGAKDPVHWRVDKSNEERLTSYLKSEYYLEDVEYEHLSEALFAIAGEMAERAVSETYRRITERFPTLASDAVNGQRENDLYELMESSMAYMMMKRCGIDPREYLNEDEFDKLSDYASPFAIAMIGASVQSAAKEVLHNIGKTVFRIQREDQEKTVEYHFTKEELTHGNDLQKERGLSVPGAEERRRENNGTARDGAKDERGRNEPDTGEVREDEGGVPQGGREQPVSGIADQRGIGSAPERDGNSGAGKVREPYGWVPESESGSREGEHDPLDSAYEQRKGDVGGNRPGGDHIPVTSEEKDGKETAVEKTAAVLTLPVLPTMEMQRRKIEERVGMLYSGSETIPLEVVDTILRTAGNRENSRYRIIFDFMLDQPDETHREYVKKEYGVGGKGLVVNGRSYSVWFGENGMEIASGTSVHDNILSKIRLSWDEISGRIHQLLVQGEYLPQDVLDEARGKMAEECASTMVYLIDSIRDKDTAAAFLPDMAEVEGSYPDRVSAIKRMLGDMKNIQKAVSGLGLLYSAAEEDEGIFRFSLYRNRDHVSAFTRLAMESGSYQARDGFTFEEPLVFVTQDEIDMFLTQNFSRRGWRKKDDYVFFCQHTSLKERARHMKNSFGIAGGSTTALYGYSHFGFNYDAKGLEFYKSEPGAPEYREQIGWNDVAKRVGQMISEGRYLSAEEQASLPEYEREQIAVMVVKFYAYIPNDIQRPFRENDEVLYGEVLDEIKGQLSDPVKAIKLYHNMFEALKAVIVDTDDAWAEERVGLLKKVKAYMDGEYTIYAPEQALLEEGEKKRQETAIEVEPPKPQQLSIFDYMDAREAERETGKTVVIDVEAEEIPPEEAEEREVEIEEPEEREDEPQKTDLQDGQVIEEKEPERTELSVAEPFYPEDERINFRITNDDLGEGGPKEKYHNNMEAIMALKQIETAHRLATPDEQEILSKYVGWGGLPQVFEEANDGWKAEYDALKSVLTPDEYRAARATTLNAFYTPPVVIKAMYEALSNFGLTQGNVLEPSCGVGNFMGLLPESMGAVKMYGVEIDSLSGRMARQLYQKNSIAIKGFEKTDIPDNFFDTVIGNIPFGDYQVVDPAYDRYHFMIHDYFIARSIDLVRPGGVIAVVTSSGTMDKKDDKARRYFAQRADLLGAIRLPNDAFKKNANTEVVADILFFQKRDRAMLKEPEWVHTRETENGRLNEYFVSHPEMVLGTIRSETTRFGRRELTVVPYSDRELSELLADAAARIHGTIPEIEAPELEEGDTDPSIPADPSVNNFSYTVAGREIYYRENSRMYRQQLPVKTAERIKGMVELRDMTRVLLQAQLTDDLSEAVRLGEGVFDLETEGATGVDDIIRQMQAQLDRRYDDFVTKNGLVSNTANRRAFSQDGSYSLISALEVLDDNGELERKADIFTKRTIRKAEPVTSVDTASEALAVSIGEKAGVDLPFMSQLTGKSEEEIVNELNGVIFKNPVTNVFEPADEYLSGNVRNKLRVARTFAESDKQYSINVEALERVQPKELDATEIEVRLGAPWVKPMYIEDFMQETFQTPQYLIDREVVGVIYTEAAGVWNITGKSADRSPRAVSTYGTDRASAYRLLEDALNLKDTKIYDTIEEDGKEKRVLNRKETMLAQQKQEMIREEFKNWIFKDIERREDICATYNEIFNSIRPREYDGSHIRFYGMNPEITLQQHQRNAIAHVLYGKNTLLAHCVGSGKTFEVTAAAMESKRLGLCRKSLIVVPNHLTEQWGSEFLRLYPGANILVATKKYFEPANRKRFCSRIATGDYDAVIIGHTQFEKIPLSIERRRMYIEGQIDELQEAIEEASRQEGSRYTVKQLEKMRVSLETKLERLNDTGRKDDVVTFEELGVDRLFVDESQGFKNLFLYTKMRNVAGISQTDAQKSSDMFMKCRYMDEITGGRGVTFATGTPISNSMVELYTLMRYLQYDTLRDMNMLHFDSWAASFGETVNSVELSPEGTGYRSKTRFARFFNLPELMSVFKEAADVQTEDMLNLPVPKLESITEVIKPSDIQKQMVQSYGERAERVRSGSVDPKEDNMLKITNDGRKCALDQRLLNPDLPDEPASKVNRCVENVAKIWEETKADRSTQLIFSDLSTPKGDGTFNVYDDIRNKLVEKGVPAEEVAFIHEYNTEARKAALFSKVRSGQVRVLIGSTQKLGAGTNVQNRLIALHHLDCPWRPSDLQQQNGRILRQGNRNPEVKIFQYVTEQTFDSYMWQILEQKQKFISQVMTSKSPVRSCEDVDDATLSYAEIKALATGNPMIKEKMELDIEMTKLKLLRSNYISQKYHLESDIAYKYPAQIQALTERRDGMKEDIEKSQVLLQVDGEAFKIEINGVQYDERKKAGEALLYACVQIASKHESCKVGNYLGFELEAKYEFFNNAYSLTIKGECSYDIELGKDPTGNITRIKNAISAIPKELEKTTQQLETAEKNLAAAKEEVEKPFAMEDEFQRKQERLVELNAMLSMDVDESGERVEEERADHADEKPSLMANLREKQRMLGNQTQTHGNRSINQDIAL